MNEEQNNNEVVTINYDELYKTETQNQKNPPINNIEELNLNDSIQFDENDVVVSDNSSNKSNEKKNFVFISMIFIILIVIILFIFPFIFKLKY